MKIEEVKLIISMKFKELEMEYWKAMWKFVVYALKSLLQKKKNGGKGDKILPRAPGIWKFALRGMWTHV